MPKNKRGPGKVKRGGPLGPHRDRTGGPPRGLAARIVRRRLEKGLTQAAAAAEMGVALRTFAGWETGTEPSPLGRRALEEWLA